TLFVLDEPSIGLHPRDMQRVIGVMKRLRDAGNSLVVVEHDPQIMLEADRILDLGPGAGERGGEIVFFGTPAEIRASSGSLTGQYLAGRRMVAPRIAPALDHARTAGAPAAEAAGGGVVAVARSNRWLELKGAAEHNLKNIDVRIPLKRLVCVTGVSGSGKSTLVEDVLYPALLKYRGRPTEAPGQFAGLSGAELIDDVVMVDQSPIGRTTRSNPASYVGAFDAIRALFAAEPAAQERRYSAGTFSFNSGNGRCPTCSGNGFEHVEMQFLSDVYLRCPDCRGRRKLFLVDEPTTGLHFEDVAKLLRAFRKLLSAGHSLLVIEHNLDVIRAADWIIDLGPEGGDRGGEILCAGTPQEIRAEARSFTGQSLLAYERSLGAGA